MPEPETVDGLAVEGLAAGLEHLLGEVDLAVAGGLGPDQRAAPAEALAGENAFPGVGELLPLAEEEADLAAAHADVAGGHVDVGADVPVQLVHEALAEAHDLRVGLALGIEVGAALAAAHGNRGQAVLEDLLEAEELEDAQVDAGVEAETALVGTDGVVELDAESALDVDLALVVLPGDAEDEDPVGLDHPLEDLLLLVLGMLLEAGGQGVHDLLDGLVELRLRGMFALDVVHELWARTPSCFCSPCSTPP